MKKNIKSNQKGYTLIELVMTMILVGIIAIPIAMMFAGQVQGTMASSSFVTAVNLGREEVEKIYNTGYDSLSTATYTNYGGYPYTVTRTVTTVSGSKGAELKNIVVDVSRSGSAQVLARLYTSVAKNIVYSVT